MQVETIAIYHPNGKDKILINLTDYNKDIHKLWPEEEAAVKAEKPKEIPPDEIKIKLLALDEGLGSKAGITAILDEKIYDNKKTCALADILGIKYGKLTKRNEIRQLNHEAVKSIMKV